MALIGKIREKSTLLMIVIGVGMLLFIAPYDQIISLFGGSQSEQAIGSFKGEPVVASEWKFDQWVNMVKAQAYQRQQQIPDDAARTQAFYQMLDDTLLNAELAKIGLMTTEDELDAITTGIDGAAISQVLQGFDAFKDRNTNQFSRDSLDAKLQILMSSNEEQWGQVEAQIKRSNVIGKYVSMVSKGIIVTDYEAQKEYAESQEKANIQYVYKEFRNVPDSVITVTDADYQAFYDEHKDDKKYEMEETRGFDFIAIKIVPSAEDTLVVNEALEDLKAKFADTKSENDSLFVMNNSDVKQYSSDYVSSNSFPQAIDTLLKKGKVGDIYGPYPGVNSRKITKVTALDSAYEASVRHILIKANPQQDPIGAAAAKAKADSIADVLRAKNNFTELLKFSEDVDAEGNPNNDGVYDWFTYGAMVKPFEDYAMTAEKNAIDVVPTQYGYHVVQALDRRTIKGEMRVKAASVEMKIVPYDKTIGEYKDSAYRFIQDAKQAPDFEEFVKSRGFLGVNTEENIVVNRARLNRPELENNYQILKWAFNSEMNEVSEAYHVKNSHQLIVAKLTQNIPEGVPSLETAKQVMHDEIVRELKGKYLANQVKGLKTLEEASKAWGGLNVFNSPGITFKNLNISAASAKNQDDDSKVVGTVFTLAAGEVSEPVVGIKGVYVIKVNDLIPIANPKEDFEMEKITMTSTVRGLADSGIMQGLRDISDIKDYQKKNELIKE